MIDPTAALRTEGGAGLARLLASAGYVIQDLALLALVEAIESGTPLLIEGPRGGGKSALPEALGAACNLDYFYLQCMEGVTMKDILYEWDRDEQSRAPRAEKFTREYLVLGEVLGAFDRANAAAIPPILHIDELDKLGVLEQSAFLGLLQNGFADIPRLQPSGRVGVTNGGMRWPLVFATSNAIDDDPNDSLVSAPLRSRFCYTYIGAPSPAEEIRVLVARVPSAHPDAVRAVVRALDVIRGMGNIIDKPGLRETIKWLREVARCGATSLDEQLVKRHLCHIAKRSSDAANLYDAAARIAHESAHANPRVDRWVDSVLDADRSAVSAAEGVAA